MIRICSCYLVQPLPGSDYCSGLGYLVKCPGKVMCSSWGGNVKYHPHQSNLVTKVGTSLLLC